MADLCFFDEIPLFLEHCVNDQNSRIIAGDFIFHFQNLSDLNTKNVHLSLLCTDCTYRLSVSLVQTVSEPTHGRGHTLNLVFKREITLSDNSIYSTRTCHDLISDHICILCRLCFKAGTCSWVPSLHSQDQHGRFFSVDIANGITLDMSLPDLNRHLSQVPNKHAPVCRPTQGSPAKASV